VSGINLYWLVSGSGGYFIRVMVGTNHCGYTPDISKAAWLVGFFASRLTHFVAK